AGAGAARAGTAAAVVKGLVDGGDESGGGSRGCGGSASSSAGGGDGGGGSSTYGGSGSRGYGTVDTSGYAALRAHPFFGPHAGDTVPYARPAVRVPLLRELCVRAVGCHLTAYADSVILVRAPVPPHADVFRLGAADRAAVRHYLGRLGRLVEPKVNRLMHRSAADAKCLRADPVMREYLGLDWDTHGQWTEPFFFVHMTDPQLGMAAAAGETEEEDGWEAEAERLRRAVVAVNRLRPRFIVVTGDLTQDRPGQPRYEAQAAEARAIMARVSETIPVLYCPGNHDLGTGGGVGSSGDSGGATAGGSSGGGGGGGASASGSAGPALPRLPENA
ncbi:unnamed protein product, partial [Phaeothamnion confervicola]